MKVDVNEEKYLDNKTFWKMLFRFLYIFFAIYALVTIIFNTFENKPFRFESFKTGKEAAEFLRNKYIGKHIEEVKADLKKVGVIHDMRIERPHEPQLLYYYYPDIPRYKRYHEKYYRGLHSYYGNNWLSLDPLWGYYFSFLLDTERNVFWVSVTKSYKFVL